MGPGEQKLCIDNKGCWEEAVLAGKDEAVLFLGDLGDKHASDFCASQPESARASF